MAEKKSFVLYLEYGEYFAELTDEQAGKVIKAIYAFEQGQELPEMSGAAKIAFSAIRNQLVRDNERWEKQVRNGKRGGRPASQEEPSHNQEESQTKPSDNPNVTQVKPNHNPNVTQVKPNHNPTETQSKANQKPKKAYMNHELCIMSNELCNIPPIVPPEGDGAEPVPKEQKATGFDEFWQSYPHKVGKKAALSAWKKLKPNAGLRAKIMEALETQKASDQWRRENGRYIPNPSTWLNQGRWDDQLDQVSTWNTSKGGTSYEPDFSKWELPD